MANKKKVEDIESAQVEDIKSVPDQADESEAKNEVETSEVEIEHCADYDEPGIIEPEEAQSTAEDAQPEAELTEPETESEDKRFIRITRRTVCYVSPNRRSRSFELLNGRYEVVSQRGEYLQLKVNTHRTMFGYILHSRKGVK